MQMLYNNGIMIMLKGGEKMKVIEVHAYHLRAELDAIDGMPRWLSPLCDLFLTVWECLFGDKTPQTQIVTTHEILVTVCGLMSIYDCVGALVREYFDTTPATVETVKILDYASSHIWAQVQYLYDDSEEVIMDVTF